MIRDRLTERERKVLEAVIHSYVETAEPAGSRTIAKKYPLGVSAATIRNTMSDLEERGYLYHPHTSAGRVPTDLAYRVYVDRLMSMPIPTASDKDVIQREIGRADAIEDIIQKSTQVLSVLTQELGVAIGPTIDNAVLERLELLQVASGRLLMVLVLKNTAARTIFVESSSNLPGEAVRKVADVLNERLSGLTLKEVRTSVHQRLRDTATADGERELLNIFVEEADNLFQSVTENQGGVVLSGADVLADQPEFSSSERMKDLLQLTQEADVLRDAFRERSTGLKITIGGEHLEPRLNAFTIITSTYRCGSLTGVIGVMGPTRMPYEKVVSLVEYTSKLVGNLAE